MRSRIEVSYALIHSLLSGDTLGVAAFVVEKLGEDH